MNADALSRMIDDRREELRNDVSDSGSVVVNAIHFKSDKTNHLQMRDPVIRWMYSLKMFAREYNKGKAPNCSFPCPIDYKSDEKVLDRVHEERLALFRQWDRIYIFNKNLFREYVDNDDNICYQYIVPKSERVSLLKSVHDSVTAGHLGYNKTLDRLTPHFYWFKMKDDVKEYVQSCELCQTIKTPRVYNKAPLVPINTSRPNQLITMDIPTLVIAITMT